MYSSRNGFDNGADVDDGYEVGSKRQRSMDLHQGGHWATLLPRPSQQHLMGSYGSGHMSAALPSRQPRSFPVVRLRGLPFNSREIDVCEFFAGLDVVDVLLVSQHNKQGRFSGDAFVVFGAPTQVDFALQRNRMKMGKRYIEVFRSRKHDYYQAVAAHVADAAMDNVTSRRVSPPPGKRSASERDYVHHTEVLKLRGLPFSASKRDIINFFRDYGALTEENVHIMTLPNGRSSGEAFVEFSTSLEAKAAMNKDKMILGTRYVDLFPSSREEATTRAASRAR